MLAADKGSELARDLDIVPNIVVGDLDSTSKGTVKWLLHQNVDFRTYPSKKEKTDGELALETASEIGADHLTITATLGGRFDHSIGNLFLLKQAARIGLDCRIVEPGLEIMFLWEKEDGGGGVELKGDPGDTVSLMPLSDSARLRLSGFEYGGRDVELRLGSSKGLSNLLIKDRGEIKIESGQVFVFHGKQRDKV